MDYSIIVESNQQIAKSNYAVDFGTAITNDTYNDEFSNNKWKIKLPSGGIKLDVGDRISYYQSMIKARGLSDEGVELIGTANSNQELTDNAGRMEFGYYVYNNWLNNAMLPLGTASLKPPINKILQTNFERRVFNYQDPKHTYNVADETDTNIPRVWWSDYGAPSLETLDDWINNGSSSLYNNANELNATKFGAANTNTTATNNLAYYTPDTQRLYIGGQTWVGPYNNGYSSYHNQALTGSYSGKYGIVKSNADFQSDLGFNSPIVIGNKITESLNNPNLEGNDEFINPTIIDYTDDLKTDTSLTNYKNYFDSSSHLQVEDESVKCFPTTFGKMITDLQNGTENFSINQSLNTKTGIALPTSAQKNKYFWNCVASGDYKRTMASSELYSNLNLSKNIDTINVNNLLNSSFYSGSAPPETNYSDVAISTNAAYPTSTPYDLGEQFCIFDDLDGFSTNFTSSEIQKKANNIIFRTDTVADYSAIKKPTTNDKHLVLNQDNILMTNMVANDDNFAKLKKVFDLLEKPSTDMKVDYSNQTFKDTLYTTLELGALDDNYSQSIYGLTNDDTFTSSLETGIPLPVSLPCVKSIADKLEGGDVSALSYTEYKKRARLPIYAGLFCDEDNITEYKTIAPAPSVSGYEITLMKEWRDNKMYEIDFHSRYNETRTPKNNGVILPSSTKFSFTDDNGNFYDDSKIKENDLGVCVAYRNLVDKADETLEFGLGNSPSANQFSLYSVDTTNNYAVNSSNFINISSDSDLTKFGDNSVQSLSTNNTIYLSQNSTNTYSETADKVDISATNAMVIEYEAPQPIMPSKTEIFQAASFPDPNASGTTEVSTPLAGANGTESFIAHLTASSGQNATDVYDNTLQTRYIFSNPHLNVSAGYEFTTPQIVNKYRIWGYPDSGCACKPTAWELRASIDKATYDTGGTGAYQVLDTKSGINTATFPSATIVASNNLNTSYEASFTNTTAFGYYVLYITANDGDNVNTTLYQFALYGDKTGEICVAGAETNNILGDFTLTGSSLHGATTYGTLPNLYDNLINGNPSSGSGYTDQLVHLMKNTNGYTAGWFLNYAFTNAQVVNKYRIWARFDAGTITPTGQQPVDWELQGSNDGSSFTSLHSVNGATWNNYSVVGSASNNLIYANEYSFTNTTPYINYRLAISVNGGHNNYCTISEFALYKDNIYEAVAGVGASTGFTSDASSELGNPSWAVENLFNDDVYDGSSTRGWASANFTFSGGNAVGYTYCGCVFDTPQIITKYNIFPSSPSYSSGRTGNPRSWTLVGAASLADLQGNVNLSLLDTQNLTGANSAAGSETSFPNINILQYSNSPAKDLTQYANNYEIVNSNPFKVYGLIFTKNHSAANVMMLEWGLYKTASSITNSRMPKEIILQGQKLNDNIWTTIENHILATEPDAAGFVAPSTLPQNPDLATLTAPYKEKFNASNQQYKKIRMVIPQAYTDNSINIGEWVLRKKNHIKTYLGNNDSAFDATKLTFEVVLTTRDEDNSYPVDNTPGVSVNINPTTTKDELQDGNTHTYTQLSMNTTQTFSTSANLVNFGERYMKITYDFPEPSPINNFLTWSNNNSSLLSTLMKNIEIHGYYSENRVVYYDILYNGTLASDVPAATTATSIDSETPYSPKETLGFNTTNKKYDAVIIIVKSNFNEESNNIILADLLVSGYDVGTNIYKQVPFIGFTCRNQISSVNKYNIPKPIEGEFFGIPRSLQNNSLSFINSWERRVVNDNRGIVVGKVEVIDGGLLQVGQTDIGKLSVVLVNTNLGGQGEAVVELETDFRDSNFHGFASITSAKITNNGSNYIITPIPSYSYTINGGSTTNYPEGSSAWVRYPNLEITMGDFKTSFNPGALPNTQPQFPYIMMGANDVSVSFDTTQSRMSLSKMHTLMKQGQEDNNMQRYYDGSMIFNSAKALVVPDGESGNDVMKIANKKTYCNSTRASFTEARPNDDITQQIIPISNPAIKQKGIASGLTGIGLLNLYAKKKDGNYNLISADNEHTYNGTILDRLGFNVKQLLPKFGQQSIVFNRGLYNKDIISNEKPLTQYNQQVSPLTTNGFINATLNASLNTNNINYLMTGSDGNNLLEKSVPQESDSLIGLNLPQKFSYSHLLVYSNIIPKYNYIGAEQINKTPCIASIGRSYEVGDVLYGNQQGIPYIVDKSYILTDIDVDLRTELGLPAPIDSGSTIVFKIDKKKHIPLEQK